jgi:hypothetical protein
MSKKGESAVHDVRSSSVVKHIHGASKEPKTSYAEHVLESNGKTKFKEEYLDEQGRFHVVVKVPGRSGRVEVHWVFNPKGEEMRRKALARKRQHEEGDYGNLAKEPRRFPRLAIRRFPRLRKKH